MTTTSVPAARTLAEFAIDLNQVLSIAVQLIQAIRKTRDWRNRDHLASGARKREPDFRITERELRHKSRDLRRFSRI